MSFIFRNIFVFVHRPKTRCLLLIYAHSIFEFESFINCAKYLRTLSRSEETMMKSIITPIRAHKLTNVAAPGGLASGVGVAVHVAGLVIRTDEILFYGIFFNFKRI